MIFVIMAIVLLVLSLIPIPFVSDLFRGLARNLAGSFGDLLVLVRSPMRFAAMAERVRDDIDSLGRDCDRFIVFAHSQLSAVAWHAIRRTAQRPPDQRANVQMFFTFGQAFRKLKSLHRLRTRVSRRTQLWFAVLTAGSTLLLLTAVWLGFVVAGTLIANRGDLGATWDDATIPILLLTACAVLVGLVQARLAHLARYNDIEAQRLIVSDIRDVRSALPAFRWVDVWASADPAPNGPLFTRPVDHVASYRIRNLASTALDHSVYWSNVTEFVSAVAFHASALTPSAPLGVEPIPSALRKAATVRESRVSTLALARLAIIAGSVAARWGLRHDLPDIGSGILGYISSLPLVPDWFSGWPPRAQGVIGALAIVAVAMAVWWILTWLWAALIHADEDAFFAKSDQPAWHAWSTAWFGAAVAVPTIAIGALAVVSGEFGALVLYGVGGLLGLGIVTLLRGREATFANPPEAFAPSADEPVPDLADHAASVGGARSDRADVSERHDDLLPDAYDG